MSLVLRHYSSNDLKQIIELHKRQGFSYDLPGLDNPMVSCMLLEQDGEVVHALLLRRTLEMYWLFDKRKETKKQTLGRMLVLDKEFPELVKKLGCEDVHAWLPPELVERQDPDEPAPFEKLLFRLGWVKPDWTCFMREVK